MRHNRLFVYVLAKLFLILVLLLSGCTSPTLSARCLKIAIHDEPTSIYPDLASTPLDISISKLLFEGLLRENNTVAEGFELALADSYTVSADQLTYTFFLKPQAKWSDGERITGHDVLIAWEHSKSNACYKELFENLSFQSPSLSRLVVSLKKKDPLLLKKLTTPIFAIFKPTSLNIYSGPFQLNNYAHGSHLLLKKNHYYYDSDRVYFKQILFSVVPNIYTAIHLVQKGKYHLTGQPWHQGIPLELDTPQLNYYSYPIQGLFFLLFNQKSSVFDSKEKSYAFFQQLNIEDIVKLVVRDHHKALLNRNSLFTSENQATILNQTSVTFVYPSNILRCQRIAEAIREDCKHKGVHVQLNGLEYHLFRNKRDNYSFDIATITSIAYYPDAPITTETISNLNCCAIPLYQIHYDFITSAPFKDLLYNASGAVDLKYVRN